MSHAQFYIGQKAFIEKDGKVLVLFNPFGELDFPGGRIENTDEGDWEAALKREVMEEVGLKVEVLCPVATWVVKIERGDTTGNLCFIIGYTCQNKEGQIKLSNEHAEYRWVNEESYLELNNDDHYFKYLQTYFQSRQKTNK